MTIHRLATTTLFAIKPEPKGIGHFVFYGSINVGEIVMIRLSQLSSALTLLGLTSAAKLTKSAFINEAKIIVNKRPGYISANLYGKMNYGEREFGETSAYAMERLTPDRNLVNGKQVWHQDRTIAQAYIGLGYGRDMMAALLEAVYSESGVTLSHDNPSTIAQDNNSNKLGSGFKVTRVCVVRYKTGIWLLEADFDNIMTLIDDNVFSKWDDHDVSDVEREVRNSVWNAISEDYYTMPSHDIAGSGIKIETGLMIEWRGAKSSIPVKLETEEYRPMHKEPGEGLTQFEENEERDEKVRGMRFGVDRFGNAL